MATATQYSITVDLNDKDTLQFLKGKSLYVFKAVKTDGQGLPTVWLKISHFSDLARFSWNETYGGYVSDVGSPVAGVKLDNLSFSTMSLGQRLLAVDDGEVSIDNNGRTGCIAIQNTGQRDWTCGMGQAVNGNISPICAFDLGGVGEKILMEPYQKVILLFGSTAQMDVGTVVAEALSASCTVLLDGTNTSRTVSFRKSSGWTGNTEGWVSINSDNLALAPELVIPAA